MVPRHSRDECGLSESMVSLQGIHKYYGEVEPRLHVLKGINLEVGKGEFLSITVTSGSGKSTLVTQILLPAIRKELKIYGDKLGEFNSFTGDIGIIKAVEFVNQNPIGDPYRRNR